MKIATYNVNSIRIRLDVILAWLEKHQPDVLCIQETKCQDELFPALILSSTGYHLHYRGMKSYNGVAVLTRVAPDEVFYGFDDQLPEIDDAPELLSEIHAALRELRPEYREVFVLFHEQGQPYDVIAEAVGRPVGTIKTWLHRARMEVLERLRCRGMVPPQEESEVRDQASEIRKTNLNKRPGN